jgi:hypothetical protein
MYIYIYMGVYITLYKLLRIRGNPQSFFYRRPSTSQNATVPLQLATHESVCFSWWPTIGFGFSSMPPARPSKMKACFDALFYVRLVSRRFPV